MFLFEYVNHNSSAFFINSALFEKRRVTPRVGGERTAVNIAVGGSQFCIMQTYICRVVSQSDVTYVPSSKEANGQLAKFYENDVVAAALRFQVHEANGNCYQDVTATDIVKISKQ